MDYYSERLPAARMARGSLVASRQAFFEQAAAPPQNGDRQKALTSLVDDKLEKFTRSTKEATIDLAKSTPDLSALEQDAKFRVSEHLSKSRSNLNQTFDSALFHSRGDEPDGTSARSPQTATYLHNQSSASFFTTKKPPLPAKKPSSPPPPVPVAGTKTSNTTSSPFTTTTRRLNDTKQSEFDRIVNSIKSTDTYRRYKNHSTATAGQPDLRRRSKSLSVLELDEDDNWVLPKIPKIPVEPVFPELSERSVSSYQLSKKALYSDDSEEENDDHDIPIENNRLTAAKSEYELRVEKSLKNLDVPDWYKKSSRPSSRASVLSGRGTPAMSSERFQRNRPDYESFRSSYSTASSSAKREPFSRMTTPSWRSYSSMRRSPSTPENEHQTMEKTQNWINSYHTKSTPVTPTTPPSAPAAPAAAKEPYSGWRQRPRETDSSGSSVDEKRSGTERYSFIQAVSNSVLSEERSYLETSFDSSPPTEYHNKVWIESSLISKPVNGFQQTDYQEERYVESNFPKFDNSFEVYEKRSPRHPDVIYNKEKPPRTGRNPFTGGLLEAVV